MQEISQQEAKSIKRLTLSFWIVSGGALLFLISSFFPFWASSPGGMFADVSIWKYLFSYSGEIADPWTLVEFLAVGAVFFLLLIQFFARRTKKTLMIITLILSVVCLPYFIRWVWIYYYRKLPWLRLDVNFGLGFYLLALSVIVILAGSILALAERRRR